MAAITSLPQSSLKTILNDNAHDFLQPSTSLHQTFLGLAKHYLDPLAEEISHFQLQRLKDDRQSRKRKRNIGDHIGFSRTGALRLKRIHVGDFDADQIWQQARKVLKAAANEIDLAVPEVEGEVEGWNKRVEERHGHEDTILRSDDTDSYDEELGEEGVDYDVEGQDSRDSVGSDEVDAPVPEEDDAYLDENLGSQTSLSDDEGTSATDQGDEYIKDKFGLNDGFFSIDQFNKHSEFLERQDARGDPDDGGASDEEEIDWTTDPLVSGSSVSTGRLLRPRDTSAHDDEADEGPTFGDTDLNAPESDDADESGADLMDLSNDFNNTNDVLYKDFFAPPARQKGQVERRRRNGPSSTKIQINRIDDDHDNEEHTQMQRAMADVQKDLLEDGEDDLEAESSEGEAQNEQNLSTHERRMNSFREEIRRLENENLANREWALLGESVAPTRPENALLEEDLDFERAGKPVPIATEEVNESIEELIKRRILSDNFDELTKRRPDIQSIGGTSRAQEEISGSKPTQGLAAEYEDEYLRKTDPNFVDKRSEATKQAHAVIAKQWVELSAQLDALSNYHYKPRPPEKNLEVRTDAPIIQMEEARPAAGAEADTSGLAPHELYKPGRDERRAGEIMTKGGTAIAKEEDSRESKRRRRRREKARSKRASANNTTQANKNIIDATTIDKTSKKTGKSEIVRNLKKGNVKVIGKKGELQDVEGKSASIDAKGRARVVDFML